MVSRHRGGSALTKLETGGNHPAASCPCPPGLCLHDPKPGLHAAVLILCSGPSPRSPYLPRHPSGTHRSSFMPCSLVTLAAPTPAPSGGQKSLLPSQCSPKHRVLLVSSPCECFTLGESSLGHLSLSPSRPGAPLKAGPVHDPLLSPQGAYNSAWHLAGAQLVSSGMKSEE